MAVNWPGTVLAIALLSLPYFAGAQSGEGERSSTPQAPRPSEAPPTARDPAHAPPPQNPR